MHYMLVLLDKSSKSAILWLMTSEELRDYSIYLRRSDTPLSIMIVYVATAGHIQIERPLKTLEEKKEKEKHNKSSVSPTEIQAVFMTLKPAK